MASGATDVATERKFFSSADPSILEKLMSAPQLKDTEQFGRSYLPYYVATLFYDFVRTPYPFLTEGEAETQVIEIPIHHQELYSIVDTTRLWTEREKHPEELEQEVLLAIVSKFSQIEKVRSIYVQKYRQELQIFILLAVSTYDYELTYNLLDIEYDIRKKYSDIYFEFFYPPVGISDKEDFIHPRAYCVYSR